MSSWVEIPEGNDFPLENLPYGVFSPSGQRPRVGVAIGEQVLDLALVAGEGLLDGTVADPLAAFGAPTLNPFLAAGRPAWEATRRRLTDLLATDGAPDLREHAVAEYALPRQDDVTLHLPFAPGDYVDFYSSREHAANLGKILRPDSPPLRDNWLHLPVGYHGRASTIVVSGTPIRRPAGQQRPIADGGRPGFGPSERLDFELEVGFVTGTGNAPGEPIAADEASDHIFGFVLVNDWSARDIQAWEYEPLGPFLGKSFATSVSPWVVTLDALAPHRVRQPVQDPPPLEHLRTSQDWGLDIDLEVLLVPAGSTRPVRLSRTEFAAMYWTCAQQLAHVTSNGTQIRPGDLYASGTVSGTDPGSYGSLIELTWNGEEPLELPDGSERTFLADGDTVILRGACGGRGAPRIGFGEVRGTVLPT